MVWVRVKLISAGSERSFFEKMGREGQTGGHSTEEWILADLTESGERLRG